jgi:hypothetical protein
VDGEGQAELSGLVTDELGILVGLSAAQPVVDVKDMQPQIPPRCEFAQGVE